MEERSKHLIVVIGASKVAEQLRRSLVRQSMPHAGVTTHLRGLRRWMVLGQTDLVVVCIALNQQTLSRHGPAMQKLLADQQCFPQSVRSIGLLSDIGMTGDMAQLGCNVYVHDSKAAAEAVRLLTRRWRSQKAKPMAAPSRIAKPRRRTNKPGGHRSWSWGVSDFPIELAPLVANQAGESAGGGSSSEGSRAKVARSSRRRSSRP